MPWLNPTEIRSPVLLRRLGCIKRFVGAGLSRDFAVPSVAHPEIATGGKREAAEAPADVRHRMARALASVMNVLDPNVIVLGGGMSNLERFYTTVPALWGPYVFSDAVATRLVRAVHGDSSGVRGAAWLWPAEPGPDPVQP
jgi:fructokinase